MRSDFGLGPFNKDPLEISVEGVEAPVDLVGSGRVLGGEVVGGLPLVDVPLGLVVEGVVVVESSSADLNVVEPEVSGERVAVGPDDVESSQEGLDLVEMVGGEGLGKDVLLEDPSSVAVVRDGS